MSRSSWKGDLELNLNRINFIPKIRIYDKSYIILPEYVGKFFEIHRGKDFYKLEITEEMVGFRFGDFVFTRAVEPEHHLKKKKKLLLMKRKHKSKGKGKSKGKKK